MLRLKLNYVSKRGYRRWISLTILNKFRYNFLFNADLWCIMNHHYISSGPRFNIKMSSYQYRKSHCGDKTVVRSSYLHNGISYTDKMTSLYWIRALNERRVDSRSEAFLNQNFAYWFFIARTTLWYIDIIHSYTCKELLSILDQSCF